MNSTRQDKPLSSAEWYGFAGEMGDLLAFVHMGGRTATQTLLDLCDLSASSNLLDVGCGPGTTACLAAKTYGCRVHGIDITSKMLETARQRVSEAGLSHRVELSQADVLNLPFEQSSFDAAVIESVLTPLAGEPSRAMAQIVRALRPGGIVAANEGILHPSAPPDIREVWRRHPGVYTVFTTESLRTLFQGAGLEISYLSEHWEAAMPGLNARPGLRVWLRFFFRTYPKMVWRLLRDQRIREAHDVDERLTKAFRRYAGYALIAGHKGLA